MKESVLSLKEKNNIIGFPTFFQAKVHL